MDQVIGYILAIAIVGGFGYFLYTKYQANQERKPGGSNGSDGPDGSVPGDNTEAPGE